MMSSVPVAGGDAAAAASGLGGIETVNWSDVRQRSVQRRMTAVEAESRKRLIFV